MKPRTLPLILALFVAILFPLATTHAQSVLYGTTGGNSPGSLYTIDPTSGAATLVAPLLDSSANPYAVTGLAFDSVTGVLYGSTSSVSPTGPLDLVTINPLSGLVAVVGSFNTGVVKMGSPETMGDLTFNSANATLYGGGSLTANLYSINLGNGQATSLGASGVTGTPRGVGIAADNSGTVFGTPNGSSGPGGQLVIYSTANGSTAVVNPLSGAPYGAGAINALAFNPAGALCGVNIDLTNTARPTDLVTIDTSTGAVTDIGASVNNLDAIVFSVPEPGTWAASILVIGYLGFVFFHRRRLASVR